MRKNIALVLSPSRSKVTGTLLVYLALFLSSWVRILLTYLFYPGLTKGFTLSELGATVTTPVVIGGLGFAKATALHLLASAAEIALIYTAVSWAVYLSSRKVKNK